MRIVGMVLLLGLAIWAIACSPMVSARDTYDEGTDFRKFKTYTWGTDVRTTTAEEAGAQVSPEVSAQIDSMIVAMIDADLQMKGLTLTSKDADLTVQYHFGSQTQVYVSDWGKNYDDTAIGHYEVQQKKDPAIMIDIVDAKHDRLAWRGWVTGAKLVDPTPDMVESHVQKAMTAVMKLYPPQVITYQ